MVYRFRLTATGVMVNDREGPYVKYDAYKELEDELEQLRQQVAAPADDGWIEWAGGDDCPVPDNTKVQVKFWDGYEPVITEPQGLRWKHFIAHANIIAYRIIRERATNQNGEQ